MTGKSLSALGGQGPIGFALRGIDRSSFRLIRIRPLACSQRQPQRHARLGGCEFRPAAASGGLCRSLRHSPAGIAPDRQAVHSDAILFSRFASASGHGAESSNPCQTLIRPSAFFF